MTPSPILTVDEMRAAEEAAIAQGTSAWSLMQRAGEGAAAWVARAASGRAITVLCGPGNNGGDGYVIAETLRARGSSVEVIAPKEPATETAQRARSQYQGKVRSDGPITHAVIVDCLFGYGLSRRVEGGFATLLEELSAKPCYKIAIDVPSAVESDTGKSLGPLPYYDLTLALGAWKRAHFLMPAMPSMGTRRCVSIGLSFDGVPNWPSARPRFAKPAPEAHKYRRGLLAVVAGSMPGAPLLSAEAAMRSGAGYVKLVSDHSHPDAPADLVIESDLEQVLADERLSAVLLGPGLGRDEIGREHLCKVLESGKPGVLDADALYLLDEAYLEGVDTRRICVTPHEGELAKLCDTFGLTADGKLAKARALQNATGLTVLAKGPDTVMVTAKGATFFDRGSSWLSVAGSGDVLAGIIASRLAVHGDTAKAAEEGVWLHHEAARHAAPAFSASDLAQCVKSAVASFL